MLAFARYFVEQAKANNMGTFYWMGLSDGEHRSVPEFNQTDLKDAIIKGYYGEDGYSGVTLPQNVESAVITDYYNLHGLRLPTPQQGLNIVRMSNGKVKTVMKKSSSWPAFVPR